MKFPLVPSLLLFFLLSFGISVVHAVRYADKTANAPRIDNLVNVLNVQQQQLEKLLGMLSRLDDWKKKLNSENQRLATEGELAKQDREKFESGQLTEDELNRKWHITGRSIKHDKALQLFTQEVADFNTYVKEYNILTKKMSHVLNDRSPPQIKSLVTKMRKLVQILREALSDGNVEKARYIAKQSAIAGEFGYSSD